MYRPSIGMPVPYHFGPAKIYDSANPRAGFLNFTITRLLCSAPREKPVCRIDRSGDGVEVSSLRIINRDTGVVDFPGEKIRRARR